jgi:hypothetical protein
MINSRRKMKTTTKNGLKSMFLLACLILSFALACPAEEIPSKRFMVTAGVDLFNGASADYRAIYGQAVLMPELKVTAKVYRNFTVWGSCALIAKDGYIEEVEETAHISQTILGFGLGYAHNLSVKLRLRGELGMTYISFREKAMAETAKGSGWGWKVGANLDYSICKKMFATLAAGYSGVSDEAEFGKIKLGGFQAGIGIGFAF